MTTDLMPFVYDDQPVRVVRVDGEPWFVLADLCAALGLSNSRQVADRIPIECRGVHQIDTPGGRQQMVVVNESGMYEVVIRSDKPQAASFRRWITHDVLPAIRRTGTYTNPQAMPTHAEALRGWASEIEAREAAEAKIAELEPKAEVADRLLDADGDLSVGDAAKALTRAGVETGPNRLFRALQMRGWIFRGKSDGAWRVQQTAIQAGYMSVLPQSHYHPRTGVLVLDPPQPRVTPKGLQRLLTDHGAVVPA